MSKILIISGSPSHPSRSAAIGDYLESVIESKGVEVNKMTVRDLPPEDVALANFNSPAIKEAQLQVQEAEAVIVISPVYKASYPGILKSFIDLIPEKGLENKVILPVVTGGTIAHLLSIEFAFKPVFSVLGSNEILNGVYLVDSQVAYKEGIKFENKEIEQRLKNSLDELFQRIQQKVEVGR